MVVVAFSEPSLTVMVAVPVLKLCATPEVLLMPATAGFDEVQKTDCRTCVLLLLKVPIAENCLLVASGTEGFAGVIAMDTSPAGVVLDGR
jgi:hypothetical protein